MNYETLYNDFKQKQLLQTRSQAEQLARIHQISTEPKININSTSILLKRTIQILDQFEDEEIINLESSIPVLRAVGMLQVLGSVGEAREILGGGDGGGDFRLRREVEFLYYLWDMVDEEEIQCRELKEIIEMLQSKKKPELKYMLAQMYKNEQKIDLAIKSYILLASNQQYYKHIKKPSKSHQSNKENSAPPVHESTLFHSKLERLERSGQLGSPIYDSGNGNGNGNLNRSTNQFISTLEHNSQGLRTNQFVYTCQLNSSQEKELVQRLYRNDKYKQREEQKKEREQQKQKQELRECTFKPNLIKRDKSVNSKSYSQIKGYDKAINRLKAGNEKNKMSKQMRDYKPCGENYEKLKQKGVNPPKFLDRKKKEEEKVLFIISFDLGRHKTNVKIRENDTEESVADRICKIYSLKKEFYEQIKEIVRNQLDAYYQQLEQLQNPNESKQQIF